MAGRRAFWAKLGNMLAAAVFAAVIGGCAGYLAERAEQDARSKVPPSAVDLSDVKFRKLADNMIEVTGRVRNRCCGFRGSRAPACGK